MTKTKKELENQVLRLLNLPPDVTIESSSVSVGSEIITISLPHPDRRICPHCGGSGCILKGSVRWQEFRHFPINNRSIVLRLFKRRKRQIYDLLELPEVTIYTIL